jgi:hypothetical protein
MTRINPQAGPLAEREAGLASRTSETKSILVKHLAASRRGHPGSAAAQQPVAAS